MLGFALIVAGRLEAVCSTSRPQILDTPDVFLLTLRPFNLFHGVILSYRLVVVKFWRSFSVSPPNIPRLVCSTPSTSRHVPNFRHSAVIGQIRHHSLFTNSILLGRMENSKLSTRAVVIPLTAGLQGVVIICPNVVVINGASIRRFERLTGGAGPEKISDVE